MYTKVRAMRRDCGVSTVLVIGGCGDYFDVADCVIMQENYTRCVCVCVCVSLSLYIAETAHHLPPSVRLSIVRTVQLCSLTPSLTCSISHLLFLALSRAHSFSCLLSLLPSSL